jgi:microcystin-dependent protein
MADWFLGEIRAWSINYAPSGWTKCEGQILQIQSNAALYSLLSTYYGGDGVKTFGLPDLRGRVIAGMDPRDPKLANGKTYGVETVQLDNTTFPSHTHTINNNNNPMPNPPAAKAALACTGNPADASSPAGNILGNGGSGRGNYRFNTSAPDSEMKAGITTVTGTTQVAGGTAHNNMAPYLPITYCIATSGMYPQRP